MTPPASRRRSATWTRRRSAATPRASWTGSRATWRTAERYPVLSRVRPGEIRDALPASAPEQGEPFDAILDDFERVIVPGLTHWNHPGFFAYFAITGSAPGVLAEFLSAALNVQAMLWRTSPAATELEEVALGWLRQLLGLPDTFEGVIYDTASVATLHGLAAAREAKVPGVREAGLAGRAEVGPLRVYCSEQAHSSVDKAVILLGLGHRALRKIPADERFRLRPDRLRAADRRGSGRRPAADRGRRHGGHDVDDERGPGGGDRGGVRGARAVAARGRGLRRRRRDGARLRVGARGLRPGGLARHQPAQVAVHAVRPERVLLAADGRGARGLLAHARVPADAPRPAR